MPVFRIRFHGLCLTSTALLAACATPTVVTGESAAALRQRLGAPSEAHFNRVRAGIAFAELRRQLGEPSRVWGVHDRNQTVWSYRYENPFCQIFNVGITPQGTVEDTSYGPDPLCEHNEQLGRHLR